MVNFHSLSGWKYGQVNSWMSWSVGVHSLYVFFVSGNVFCRWQHPCLWSAWHHEPQSMDPSARNCIKSVA